MKPFLLIASLLLAACAAAPEQRTALPWSLMSEDRGDVSGVWRELARNGRPVRSGYLLTIDLRLGTFAVQKGCSATGGVLAPLGGDHFRIERYESGFAVPDCGPWRATPELAPFNGAEVRLTRSSHRMRASGGGHDVELTRMTLRGRP